MANIGLAKGAEERGHAREALDADSVREAYRRWAGVYDLVFGGVSAFGRRRAVETVNRLAGPRVLEVGVGTGLALPLYRRDLQVVGIDLSREMLAKAHERVAEDKLSHVRGLVEMNAEEMAFEDGSFDIAVAMFTASVVPDARRLYAEMSRVVRPGGICFSSITSQRKAARAGGLNAPCRRGHAGWAGTRISRCAIC